MRRLHTLARRELSGPTRFGEAALAVAAAAVAGPWPTLPAISLAWRLPLAAVALIPLWRRRATLRVAATLTVAAALILDAAAPGPRSADDVAARVSERVWHVETALAGATETPEAKRLYVAEGGEVDPTAPFDKVEGIARSADVTLDTLVLVDERGQPVAWAGRSLRLPVRLRLLGEPVVFDEPGVGEEVMWWRAPIFEGGRIVGALLAAVVIPESGARRVLGVWAGRGAVAVPLPGGGSTVRTSGGVPVVGIGVWRTRAEVWSLPALGALLMVVFSAATLTLVPRALLLGAAAGCLVWLAGFGGEWWLVLGLLLFALWLWRWPERGPVRVAAAGLTGALGVLIPGVLTELGAAALPQRLLLPGPFPLALVIALTLVVRAATGAGPRRSPTALAVLAWLPLAVGVVRADPALLGLGTATVVYWGLPRRGYALPAVVAASLLLGSSDMMRRSTLVSTTESTLARLENVEGPARALLGSLPESALSGLTKLEPPESLVVLGRVVGWFGIEAQLPGVSLVLSDANNQPVATWGEMPLPGESGRVLARRELAGGGALSLVAPPPPRDVLSGLAASGAELPLAAFNRSGSPQGRGAIFRPLSAERVGRALAENRSWGRVGVGERVYLSYLRAHGDTVLAVPWVRRPPAEAALVLAALALWGGVPLGAWGGRARWRMLWRDRRSFSARVRVLAVGAALVPVLLLGELLPGAWAKQQQRARLELGRAISGPLQGSLWEPQISWLVREVGGTVAVYRLGSILACSRPDLVARGVVAALPPREAYIRAVRGWREPLVEGGEAISVFVAPQSLGEATVVGVFDLQMGGLGSGPSPREWFATAGVLALLVALALADRLGRRVAYPLRRLVRAARRLERGERVSSLAIAGDEDVASLGRAFSTMAETVQRREEELRRERDLLDRVLGALSAGVVVWSEDRGVELANDAARKMLSGGATKAALAARFGDVVESLLGAAAGGQGGEEVVRPRLHPEEVWRITALPLAQPAGRVLLVMEDLSEVARAERLASLAELARIAAHEVKNPLTPIRLWAEELQAALQTDRGRVAEVAKVAAEQIIDRVEHLREVAQSFSNLVALEHWEGARVDVGVLAEEVTGEYAVLRQRGIEVRLKVRGDCTVLADPQWLRRALRHLLENSARALAGKRGEVIVSLDRDGSLVTLAVQDSGGGVAEEHLGDLFEPHFSTTSEGSGLGLAVVQRVAERAGGRVEARNTKRGLEVRLILPAAPAGDP